MGLPDSLLRRIRALLASGASPARSSVADLHSASIRRGEPTYDDPESGDPVFTSSFLKSRGHCCGSYCRHCPYGPEAQAAAAANPPPDTEH
jgi:hypothetical protein